MVHFFLLLVLIDSYWMIDMRRFSEISEAKGVLLSAAY